ncbi:hypothetical protein ACFLZ1_04340 [Patescibacteria group bacterium]
MPTEQLLSPEILTQATENYFDALNLPPDGPVLFIIDKPNDDNINIQERRRLAEAVENKILTQGICDDSQVATLEFGMENTYEEFFQQTSQALEDINEGNGDKNPVTLVYLGDQWSGRRGLYHAFAKFGQNNDIRTRNAVSLGMNQHDILMLPQIDSQKREKIAKPIEYLKAFFEENRKGKFKIETEYQGQRFTTELDYDYDEAEFEPDWGFLSEKAAKKSFEGYGIINEFENIPGGEVYGTPFPWKNSNGQFVSKEGMVLTIMNGFITNIRGFDKDINEIAAATKDKSIIDCVNLVNSGSPIPLSELGFGVWALAGLIPDPRCSTLCTEKGDIHFGAGDCSESTEAAEIEDIIDRLGFNHADFIARNAKVYYQAEGKTEFTQMWPPTE